MLQGPVLANANPLPDLLEGPKQEAPASASLSAKAQAVPAMSSAGLPMTGPAINDSEDSLAATSERCVLCPE